MTFDTSSQTSPPGGAGSRSKYSVIDASSLYGTPFLRRYPARKPVVTTFSEPPSAIAPAGGGPPRRPLPPPPGTVGLNGVGGGAGPRPPRRARPPGDGKPLPVLF